MRKLLLIPLFLICLTACGRQAGDQIIEGKLEEEPITCTIHTDTYKWDTNLSELVCVPGTLPLGIPSGDIEVEDDD